MTAEQQRLEENKHKAVPLEKWGPYLSERQWGTVREDYGPYGDAWGYFPFEHSHFRSYLWGEDGIAGISDYFQNLCFAISLWNGKDAILKERLFGLGNYHGNHGEDVKELYYYLDNTPSHYYMEYLYKCTQAAFPYKKLADENRKRSKHEPEFEILDTPVFKNNHYFDVKVTYAKYNSNDIVIKIDVTNRYYRAADLSLLPTLWFANKWSNDDKEIKPVIEFVNEQCVHAWHHRLGDYYFYFSGADDLLFTENETNTEKLNGTPNASIFVKDAFHDAVIHAKNIKKLRDKKTGTKCAPLYQLHLKSHETKTIYCRLVNAFIDNAFPPGFEQVFEQRKKEADEFYNNVIPQHLTAEQKNISRQAYAGLLWSKQYYGFDVEEWISKSDGITPVNDGKKTGRNNDWKHLKNSDVILMPDKWEYPWYAAWDLAFHCIAMASIDPVFAKHQLLLIMREWYMKPDGQLPAYEWNFGDVNPPVHALAAWNVYQIEKKRTGKGDIQFLKRIFQKLLINFTWWINRKDENGNNLFQGGFLGLDNIGVFNRSHHIPGNHDLEQADGTAWMGMYALNMMDIALEIALHDDSFEDTATRFFEHFVLIAEALNEQHTWNEEDKFYYDVLCLHDGSVIPLRIQSAVGLTTLYAVSTINRNVLGRLKDFKKRINWFENYRKSNGRYWPNEERSDTEEILLSIVPKEKLLAILKRLLDETEFLSVGGIRALSKHHEKNPYSVTIEGETYSIQYDPGDSTSDMFGGNSNWRGPVWMPLNFLIIQSIKQFGKFYGDTLQVEYPRGSGNSMNLEQVAKQLTNRVLDLFYKDELDERRCYEKYNWFYKQEGNRHLVLFYEYFHGDSGKGLGANHQTGWTALIAHLLQDL
ncbi:MAG: glucosidase [Chitinophagaceae bacterium]|nr:glucosidase [Chitinophagaceae bacterium]